MRIGAVALAAAVLAGCSTTSTTATAVRGGPPVAGNSVDAVIAWVEAGRDADAADFHTAERDGDVTDLGDNVAFRLPRDLKPRMLNGCMTNYVPHAPARLGTLECLVNLTDPPPRPQGLPGQWVGGWVQFDGATVTVGGLHGDPGPFSYGNGRPLLHGERVKFGDFQCRSDPSGLYCVNYPHHSAVLLGETLIAWGCEKRPTPPLRVGEQYDCGP